MRYPIRELTEDRKESINKLKHKINSKEVIFKERECPICNSKRTIKMFSNDRFGLPINLGMCRRCGLVYENPVFDDKSLMDFYSSNEYRSIYGGIEDIIMKERYQYDSSRIFDINNYSAKESFFKFIENSKIKYKSVMEVGAGGGWNARPFIEKGYIYSGIEPTKYLVNEANRRGLNITNGFLRDVNRKYDLIIMRHVLEHLKNPVEDLKYLANFTSILAIEIPGFINNIPSLQNAHLFYFSLNTLTKTCSLAGFEIKEYKVFRKNGFIMALLEKKGTSNYKYSFFKERIKILSIYSNLVLRLKVKAFKNKFLKNEN